MTAQTAFLSALESAKQQPQAVFAALNAMTESVVGVRLFTLMTFDSQTRGACRIYSNRPDVYPVLGTKPVNETYWSDMVLDRHETFVANSLEEIAEVFYDHELIGSLGCQSAINVPIVIAGEVIGTINCLHEGGYYTRDRVLAADRLKLPGAAAFLLDRMISAKGA